MPLSCRCNTHVHPRCLKRWLSYRSDAQFPLLSPAETATCEVCNEPFYEDALETESKSSENDGFCSRLFVWFTALFNYLLTVEGCLLLFLFVLAAMGHILFVISMYSAASDPTEYSLQRLALALVNAMLTLSLLVVVQRVVSRRLREGDFVFALANASLIPDVENALPAPQSYRPCGFVYQLLLGGFLSALAAAEIFFLVRQLPFTEMA